MPFRRRPPRFGQLCAIALCLSIGACVTPPPKPPAPPPPPPVVVPPAPLAAHPLDQNLPSFLKLPNLPAGKVPVRVGIILPIGGGAAATRNLATAMLNAAELALFDSKNKSIVLMIADEGNSPAEASAAAKKLLAQGAEILVGPLFGTSVTAVAPIARDRGVPVLAFSTERTVAGNGAFLLSFLPENEVARVVNYAARNGHHQFALLAPETPYGDVAKNAFDD